MWLSDGKALVLFRVEVEEEEKREKENEVKQFCNVTNGFTDGVGFD